MCRLCRKSFKTWTDFSEEFDQLYKVTKWIDHTEEIDDLCTIYISRAVNAGQEMELYLHGNNSQGRDHH